MSDIVKGFRFVTQELKSQNGDVQWTLGEWNNLVGNLELCENGFHACREPFQSVGYVFGTRWFRCEARGEILEGDDKFCASEMRLTEEISVKVILQWAVDCAYRVLSVFEKLYPGDDRPHVALRAAQQVIDEPSEENRAAAGAAAGAAARAARAAARAAAGAAAGAAGAARAAAGAAAGAARAAARAAREAAGAAEEKWQKEHLEELIEKEADG